MIEDAVSKFSEGMRQLQAKDYEQAVEAFTSAINTFPQFEPAFRLRAEAYRSLGRDQAADADLNSVISITRARLQEAEQSLGGPNGQRVRAAGPASPAAPPPVPSRFAKPKPGLLQSPIILGTGVVTGVLLVGAVVLMFIGG
jgi:tetratricopeptide (TPR) repeat protein